MSAPTAIELEALTQFRLRVIDLGLEKETDLSMLRWLRVCDLKVKQAEEMLRKHIQWHEDERISEIMDWVPPQIIQENFPYEITGHDDNGRPLCILPIPNIRKMVKSGKQEECLRNTDFMIAQLHAKMKENFAKFNWEITQCIFIVDFAKFSMSQFTSVGGRYIDLGVNLMLEAARRCEAHYPDFTYAVYVVNTSRVFELLFTLMKPFLSDLTKSKIHVYTTPDKWIPVLQASLPLNQLPSEFGGTKLGRRISTGDAFRAEMVDLDNSETAEEEILAAHGIKLQ